MVGQDIGPSIALDIGTTTIAGASVDLPTGRITGASAVPNPQSRWGSDVLARINAVADTPGLLKDVSAATVAACNELIAELSGGRDAAEITAAGNPAMEHLLLGVSPASLARVPYKPAFLDARRLNAKEAGFNAAPGASLYVFPLIGGFVGGDTVAAALYLGLHKEEGNVLAVDIGTNSEIILASKGRLYATSAAAGPAFEGGGLKCGMSAGKGAIRGVRVEEDSIKLDVMGDSAPRGICGSGLIEAASALLKAGVIDRSGRIRSRDEVATNLSARIREASEGNSFVLYKGAKSEVELTQPDVRALQAAKSAIRAGIEMLFRKAGISGEDLRAVYIAGAFGSSLKQDGLEAIGLLDGAWLKEVSSVGDAALYGAALALSDGGKTEAEAIAKRTKYVPLSGSAPFERAFLRNMDF